MIRQIRGRVLETGLNEAVVEIAGFGVLVHTAGTQGFPAGAEASFYTSLVVKQDGMDLYGFTETADRDFFELLTTVSGVGPKTALAILRRSSREGMESAIARRDITYLTRVAGLGKKSAEKIAVELSEKLAQKKDAGGDEDAEVFDTLVALGYTEREARGALSKVPNTIFGKEARLRAALSASHP